MGNGGNQNFSTYSELVFCIIACMGNGGNQNGADVSVFYEKDSEIKI